MARGHRSAGAGTSKQGPKRRELSGGGRGAKRVSRRRGLDDLTDEDKREIAALVSPEVAEAEARDESVRLHDRLLPVLFTKAMRGESLRLSTAIHDYARWYGSLATRGGSAYSEERYQHALKQLEEAAAVRRKIRFLREKLPRKKKNEPAYPPPSRWMSVFADAGFAPAEVKRAYEATRSFYPLRSEKMSSHISVVATAAALRMSMSRARRLNELVPRIEKARQRLKAETIRSVFVRLALAFYQKSLQRRIRREVEQRDQRPSARRRHLAKRKRIAGISSREAADALLARFGSRSPR